MIYPDKLMLLSEGIQLYIPDPELVRSIYEEQLAKDSTTPFPFWAKIWPSAKAMTLFLGKEPVWIEGRSVLEIGAGIALPSFAIAKHAAEMIISDHSADAVCLMEKNIHYLGLDHVKAMCLDWNSFPEEISAQTVILSDINYAPDQFPALLALIRKFLLEGANILLSTPQRITITPFAEAIEPFIKRSVLQTVEEPGQETEIRVLVLAG